MPQARLYVSQVLLLTLSMLGFTALFNEVTDPYGIYATLCRVGANANKPGQKGHDRLVKAYAIKRRAPDVLLLGTSRVQYGINPDDPALKSHGMRPYNAALLGSNVYLALRYLQHAEAISHVRLAVVGLDPLMFDDRSTDAARDFSEDRLAVSAQGKPQPWAAWSDVPSTLLSADTTRLSVRTWRKQSHIVSDLTEGGQRSLPALQRLYNDGTSMMERFISVDGQYAKDYRRAVWPSSSPDAPSPSITALKELLDFALAHDIELAVYMTPEHVHLHEVAAQSGQTAALDALVARIVATVEAAQARAAQPGSIALWDFAILNPLTLEPVPVEGTTTMQWFWEPTHTKDTFGHLLLARMLDRQAPKQPADAQEPLSAAAWGVDEALSDSLGAPLTSAGLPARSRVRAEALQRWEKSHPEEVAAIRARVHSSGE